MGPLDRGILLLYTFTLTLLLLALAAFLAGWQEPFDELMREAALPEQQEILWILIGLYVLIGVRLFWKGLVVERKKKQAVVQDGELGDVRVSLPAIESLAEKVVSTIKGVRDVRAKVVSAPQGINMHMNITVSPDSNVPALSKDIQQQVRDSVLNVAGIAVHEVRVAVESFTSRKNRVE